MIDRDVEGIRSRDRHYWSGCERSARIGQALLRADRPDAAAESFATTLDARCRLHRADRAWLVSARVGLAEHRLAAGDLEGVASHLAAYDVLWPRPESDVPLAVRAEAVRQALPR